MRVLIVDDSRSSLAYLAQVVGEHADCDVSTSPLPSHTLSLCRDTNFDLLLVDNEMPEMDGVELTRRLRGQDAYRSVPIVMVTSDSDSSLRKRAITAGATDFVNKPFDRTELLARIRNLLDLRSAQIELSKQAERLAEDVATATSYLAQREEEIIWRLSRAIEYRDGETGNHVSRVALISRLIAEEIGLPEDRCRIIYLASPLHDIGKIGIADAILCKPGRLTDEEMARMREHVNIGARILENGSSDVIRVAELIAQSHHERWDGAGYPSRLAGDDIPIEARIVAIADVFDALCSERPYKKAWPVEDACAEIVRCRGSQFDPALVDAFDRRLEDILQMVPGGSGQPAGVTSGTAEREGGDPM